MLDRATVWPLIFKHFADILNQIKSNMLQKLELRVGVNMLVLTSQSKRSPLRISCSSFAPLLLSSSSSAIPPLPQLLTKRAVFLPEGGTRLSEKSELKLKPGCRFVTSLPPLSDLCSCLKPWSRLCSCTPPAAAAAVNTCGHSPRFEPPDLSDLSTACFLRRQNSQEVTERNLPLFKYSVAQFWTHGRR